MKRFIIIFLASLVLTTGSYKLEGLIISVIDNLVSSEISDSILDILNIIEKKENVDPQPSEPPFPNIFESTPSPEPMPTPTPEPVPDKVCFACEGSGECHYCDGVGVVFGPRFGIYSGYGMDTLFDKVCFLCKGSGMCTYCE